jgi:hypothetical protein
VPAAKPKRALLQFFLRLWNSSTHITYTTRPIITVLKDHISSQNLMCNGTLSAHCIFTSERHLQIYSTRDKSRQESEWIPGLTHTDCLHTRAASHPILARRADHDVLAEPAELPAQVARTGRGDGRASGAFYHQLASTQNQTQRHPSFVTDRQSATPHHPSRPRRELLSRSKAGHREASVPPGCCVARGFISDPRREGRREISPLARAGGAPGQANAGGLAGGAAVSVRPVE